MPKAKPVYLSLSIPQLVSTCGCTIPQPMTSSHLPLSSRISTSAEGSVNGKNDGRKRTVNSLAKNASKNSSPQQIELTETSVTEEMIKIWKEEGKMIEVAVIKTKINYEAKPLPKGITRESYLEMISAVDSKCPEKGEKMVKQLLQIAPNDPMLLNSLCLAYANQGKHKETEELTRKISIDNPSYLPAKLTIISLEIKNGNYEIANELLFEVMQTEEIHYQDFNRYLRLSMNLAWLKKDYSELKRLMKLSREHGLDDKVQEYEEMLHTVKMNEIYN